MKTYEFVTIWRVAAPIDRVWNEIYHSRDWPAWWKGVESVVEVRKGDEIVSRAEDVSRKGAKRCRVTKGFFASLRLCGRLFVQSRSPLISAYRFAFPLMISIIRRSCSAGVRRVPG